VSREIVNGGEGDSKGFRVVGGLGDGGADAGGELVA